MLVREIRAMSTANGAPRQSAGRINWLTDPQPAAGKIGIQNTNTMIATPAITKLGTAIPIVAIDISVMSAIEPRCTADVTPATSPKTTANVSANTPSAADTGSPSAITRFTVKSPSLKL